MKPLPPFRWYFAAAAVAAALVLWLPFRIGGAHDYLRVAVPLTFAWLALFALGLLLYRRRGLWLLLAAPPALLWLYVMGLAIECCGWGSWRS